uniref:Uncharacterized protein n=1 Tax=Fagus sylvatica TaxID=28930 RepID=A0A2N9G629_FAGSY
MTKPLKTPLASLGQSPSRPGENPIPREISASRGTTIGVFMIVMGSPLRDTTVPSETRTMMKGSPNSDITVTKSKMPCAVVTPGEKGVAVSAVGMAVHGAMAREKEGMAIVVVGSSSCEAVALREEEVVVFRALPSPLLISGGVWVDGGLGFWSRRRSGLGFARRGFGFWSRRRSGLGFARGGLGFLSWCRSGCGLISASSTG